MIDLKPAARARLCTCPGLPGAGDAPGLRAGPGGAAAPALAGFGEESSAVGGTSPPHPPIRPGGRSLRRRRLPGQRAGLPQAPLPLVSGTHASLTLMDPRVPGIISRKSERFREKRSGSGRRNPCRCPSSSQSVQGRDQNGYSKCKRSDLPEVRASHTALALCAAQPALAKPGTPLYLPVVPL